MARGKTPERHLTPDYKYNSVKITQLIHYIMKEGKKDLAQNIVYKAFAMIKEKTGEDPMEIFEKAAENVKPNVEVKARRVGGANLQIPIEVRNGRKDQLFLRWITKSSRDHRKEKTMSERLGNELIDASKGEGHAVKKRMEVDRAAQSHKAYSHLK